MMRINLPFYQIVAGQIADKTHESACAVYNAACLANSGVNNAKHAHGLALHKLTVAKWKYDYCVYIATLIERVVTAEHLVNEANTALISADDTYCGFMIYSPSDLEQRGLKINMQKAQTTAIQALEHVETAKKNYNEAYKYAVEQATEQAEKIGLTLPLPEDVCATPIDQPCSAAKEECTEAEQEVAKTLQALNNAIALFDAINYANHTINEVSDATGRIATEIANVGTSSANSPQFVEEICEHPCHPCHPWCECEEAINARATPTRATPI